MTKHIFIPAPWTAVQAMRIGVSISLPNPVISRKRVYGMTSCVYLIRICGFPEPNRIEPFSKQEPMHSHN